MQKYYGELIMWEEKSYQKIARYMINIHFIKLLFESIFIETLAG